MPLLKHFPTIRPALWDYQLTHTLYFETAKHSPDQLAFLLTQLNNPMSALFSAHLVKLNYLSALSIWASNLKKTPIFQSFQSVLPSHPEPHWGHSPIFEVTALLK